MSYVRWLELGGTLETVEEINAAVAAETGGRVPETDPFFDRRRARKPTALAVWSAKRGNAEWDR